MNTTMLIPCNWFKREDNYATRMLARRPRRHYNHMMSAEPLYREMDRLFNSLMGTRKFANQKTEPALLRPSLDISGDAKQYFVTVELPGVDEKDLRVELDNDSLRIYGEKKCEVEEKEESGKGYYRMERSYGSFQRVLTLPEDVDTSGISASHKDGILTITLPRKEAVQPENKNIAINKE